MAKAETQRELISLLKMRKNNLRNFWMRKGERERTKEGEKELERERRARERGGRYCNANKDMLLHPAYLNSCR